MWNLREQFFSSPNVWGGLLSPVRRASPSDRRRNLHLSILFSSLPPPQPPFAIVCASSISRPNNRHEEYGRKQSCRLDHRHLRREGEELPLEG